jgi:hypothetical protein
VLTYQVSLPLLSFKLLVLTSALVDPFNKQESDASQGHLGHAFIKFASEPLAKQAVEPVRGIELQGSPLRVQVADGKPGVRLRLSDVPEIGPSQWSHLFEELPGLERIEHGTSHILSLISLFCF